MTLGQGDSADTTPCSLLTWLVCLSLLDSTASKLERLDESNALNLTYILCVQKYKKGCNLYLFLNGFLLGMAQRWWGLESSLGPSIKIVLPSASTRINLSADSCFMPAEILVLGGMAEVYDFRWETGRNELYSCAKFLSLLSWKQEEKCRKAKVVRDHCLTQTRFC